MPKAVVVASANGAIGIPVAREILEAGGSALDAVEAATKVVEDDPSDHTVGTGGFPNLIGVVELDASIVDGTTRRAGAVGALAGYRHPISVARAVMERLPHVLIVGEGAARFASEIGAETAELLTPEAEAVWRDGLEGRTPEDLVGATMLHRLTHLVADPERAAGTVDVLARDQAGRLASAVSTSGWAWKYPGRLGDTPVIGAGNYADDRFGAAACTGWGELAIRAGTARQVIAALEAGRRVGDAARTAIEDLFHMDSGGAPPLMHLIALAADGTHAGATTKPGATYAYWTEGMAEPAIEERLLVTAP